MNDLKTYINRQIQQLDSVIAKAERFLKKAPAGSLHVLRSHHTVQYVQRIPTRPIQEKYIKRADINLAQELAQKDYAIKLVKYAKHKKALLKSLDAQYNWEEISFFHKNLSANRQALITPFVINDSEYAATWLKKELRKLESVEGYALNQDKGVLTERGELVRSKSEKIIADKFYMMDIPYIYEKPLFLSEDQKILPDFTILNKRTRKEYYWEHFGMMEIPEYAENAVKKISKYQKAGFLQGKHLLITYETTNFTLNTKELEALIQQFLI